MSAPKQFNIDRISHFVLLPEIVARVEKDGPNVGQTRPAIGTVSFRTYTDRAGVFGVTGREVQYVVSKDDRGRPKGKWFTLGQSHNAFRVNETDRDADESYVDKDGRGKRMFDFIANSPWCEGSLNGTYINVGGEMIQTNVKYRLMDSERDAEIALEAATKRAEAQSKVIALDPQTLLEVAAVGINYRSTEKLTRHKVLEWAGIRPDDFEKILSAGDRAYRAVVRKGCGDGVLTKKGEIIFWGDTVLGTNEDSAVKALMEDKLLFDTLKEAVKIEFSEPEKRKIGRPKGK